MGSKKKKEPQQTPENDTVTAPSSIFDKLFGNAPELITAPVASLFSDENPFKKKPLQPTPISDPIDHNLIPKIGVENGVVDEKKRKRNREKSPVLDSNSAIKVSEKKKKKNSGSGEAEEKELNLDGEAIEKKRKRDEVEKEWEEKKYGVVEGGDKDENEGFVTDKVGNKRKIHDNPADMLVSREGFDDEDKLLRTIFVGNLPINVKKKTLIKEFKNFGEVESVRIRSVPLQDTKKPRKGAILSKKINESAESVNAYIVFKTEESAQASLSHNMNVVDGNHIRVDRACPPRKKHKGDSAALYDNKRTVFVGNLPFDVKDEELYQLFGVTSNLESTIEAVRVVRDPHLNVGKGIAYVLFKTWEAAISVVRKRSLKLRDRELRLSIAKTETTQSKKPYSPAAQVNQGKPVDIRSKRPYSPAARHSHGKPDATPSKRPYSPAAQAHSTPAKKFSAASRSPSSSRNGSNRKPVASYQGLRATKTVVHKKSHGGEKPKERLKKRPTVAARKAKAKMQKEGGTPKQAGSKRKFESRTPDSSLRVKKAPKNR